jgi:hypothetical protein
MNKSNKIGAYFFGLVLFCLFGANIWAQEQDPEQNYYVEVPRVFYGGLLLGANFSQIDGDYYAGYHKVGLNVGGIAYAQLKTHLALSMEILYSEKGSKISSSDPLRLVSVNNVTYATTDYGIKLNYAEVPVMINYFDKRKSHAGIGFAYGRLVSATENITTYPSPPPVDLTKYDFKKDALDAIAGVDLHLWKGLFLNFRFQYSLLPVRDNIPPYFARAKQYSNMYILRLMYLFI